MKLLTAIFRPAPQPLPPPPSPELFTRSAAWAAVLLAFGAAVVLRKLTRRTPLEPGGGRWVLITGCDSGFGRGLVYSALEAGFRVIAACYTADGAEGLSGTAAMAVVADLATAEGRERVVESALKLSGGRLFGLVNNAGICLPGNAEWLPLKAYERSMDILFYAPVALVYDLLPALKAAKGRVVNVTSVDGFLALPTNGPYVAAKHALEGYSDSLRCEMRPWGVKVVCIQPATMRTPLAMSFADGWLKGFKEAAPARKAQYGDEWAEKVAAATKQGLSDLAADPHKTVVALMRALRDPSPPPRMTTGTAATLLFKPLSRLPDATRDALLYGMSFSAGGQPAGLLAQAKAPPAGVVSHVTIRVRSLAASVPWYEKWGFARLGAAEGGVQFLEPGKHAKWTPRLLLLEDAQMAARGDSFDAGMTRLCLYTADINKGIAKLAAAGLEPIAPPAGKAGTIAAYKDPDGFVVYLIMFHMPLAPILWGVRAWFRVGDPQLFHWTVNVTQIETALTAFEAFGFEKVYDAPPQSPQYDMLPPFGIREQGSAIRHIRMCKLREDSFCAVLMEWTTPRTAHRGAEKLNSMAIAVDDVGAALAKASAAGLPTEPAARRRYPVLGEALVGACLVDGSRVELLHFDGAA